MGRYRKTQKALSKITIPEGMKIFAFIQARMGSKRLPGKVLRDLHGEPLLGWVVKRANLIHPSVEVAVLTGDNAENTPIVDWCSKNGIRSFRGPEENVLGRFVDAASQVGADSVIRLTGDNPLFDYELAGALLAVHLSCGCQYTSNKTEFGSQFPDGIGVEIFNVGLLTSLLEGDPDEDTIEHLNEHIINNPEQYHCLALRSPLDMSLYSFSIDTEEDFDRVSTWIKPFMGNNPLPASLWKDVISESGEKSCD